MIASIRGRILDRRAPVVVVEANGIGYELQTPMNTFYQLTSDNHTEVQLFTHFIVREDAHLLFGFLTLQERELFRELVRVNGVGPKMALAVMSALEPALLVDCVTRNDVAALVKIPGIGRKTAERMLVELRDRFKGWQPESGHGVALSPVPIQDDEQFIRDAESALVALGYKLPEASRLIAAVLKETPADSSEELIRLALKRSIR